MNIIGHGVDVVDAVRFSKLSKEKDQKHLTRYFTNRELELIERGEEDHFRLATRFAAKEAIMKALNHGFGDGLGFTDIEIEIGLDGVPHPTLHGKALELANEKGIREWWLSLSHSGGVAFASAIACG